LLQSAATGGVYAGNIVSAATTTVLGGMIHGIKTLVMPPPKKLEWYETDEFKTAVGFIILLAPPLLVIFGLKWCLQAMLRKLRR